MDKVKLKSKINILHLRSSLQTSTVVLGAERVVLNLCRYLQKDFFEPIIAVLKDPRAKGELPLITQAKNYQIKTEEIFLKQRFDFNAVFQVRQLLEKHKIDILHCHDYKSNLIGWLAAISNKNVSLMATLHGWTAGNIKLSFYEFIDSIVIRYFPNIVIVSQAMRQRIDKRLNISVIPNGVDLTEVASDICVADIKKELNLPQEAIIIGTVGRLSSEKGQRYLLEAFARISNDFSLSYLVIVGDGPQRHNLERLAQKLGLSKRSFFTGYREDAKDIISAMDIFVLPSLTEGTPMALLEAMAQAKPVIATNVGGIPALIENNKTGILIPAKNIQAIATALKNLLPEGTLRQKLGLAALNLIKDGYSITAMVQKYADLYKRIISG